jgi:hypothetical protein
VNAVDEVLQLTRGLDRRLALLVRERLDDLVLALGHQFEPPADDLGALLRVRPRPLPEGRGGRLHRELDSVDSASGDSLVDVLGSRVDDLELAGRGRVRLLASDQHLHHRASSLTIGSSR